MSERVWARCTSCGSGDGAACGGAAALGFAANGDVDTGYWRSIDSFAATWAASSSSDANAGSDINACIL